MLGSRRSVELCSERDDPVSDFGARAVVEGEGLQAADGQYRAEAGEGGDGSAGGGLIVVLLLVEPTDIWYAGVDDARGACEEVAQLVDVALCQVIARPP